MTNLPNVPNSFGKTKLNFGKKRLILRQNIKWNFVGPVSQTVAASIEYNPAGPQPLAMMNLDMRNRAAATLPRPRSLDSVSDHIYETYKHRTDSGSMISESSSAEQLQTLGVSVTPSIAMATLPLRVPPPPVAPKPSFPRQSSVPASEASTSTSHPVAGEETVVDKL